MIREQHFVTYVSPGTFFHETTSKPIEAWDPPMAVRMEEGVVERCGARPYCFYFETRLVADDLHDGRGGTLRVEPRTLRKSGNYFLGGTKVTLAEMEASGEEIAASNMRCMGCSTAIVSTRSYKVIRPFEGDDCIVDDAGRVVVRATPEAE